ncbi:MAG: hypothetical protein RLZZ58_2151, partial [Pseudomonadota bacterium]
IIISDDASDARNGAIIRALPHDKLVLARRNSGLGANCNRGLAAATGDYVLQMQDDWITVGAPTYLQTAVSVLNGNDDIGLVTFRPRPDLDAPARRTFESHAIQLIQPRLNAAGSIDAVADGIYTDNPHLKRRNFHDIVGLYAEGIPMTHMELAMSRAVVHQPQIQVAFIEGYEVFRHIGAASSFNPGTRRHQQLEALGQLPGGNGLIALGRQIRRWWRGPGASA